MTHQTNEEFREKIADFLGFHVNSSDMDKLMSLIPQPEQKDTKNEN